MSNRVRQNETDSKHLMFDGNALVSQVLNIHKQKVHEIKSCINQTTTRWMLTQNVRQANEQNKYNHNINLVETPKEILADILAHLDDSSLLKASHVCTSFAAAAEIALDRKYSNECNIINHDGDNTIVNYSSKVLRYDFWFPRLKILKIHLEHHSANEFLQNLEDNFCEQIAVLWLNTKTDAEDADMTNVLAKFNQLKSLHLTPTSLKCDVLHLFSVCQNLSEIKSMRTSSHCSGL